MPTGERKDPITVFAFWLDVEGKYAGVFRECSGLSSENPVIEYWAGAKEGDTRFYKQPGRIKYNDITLKAGVTKETLSLWKWRKEVEDGNVKSARATASLYAYDQDNTVVAQWELQEAWPVKISGPTLNAGQNESAVEEITIAVEKFERKV
jgi:phage tail-like protein